MTMQHLLLSCACVLLLGGMALAAEPISLLVLTDSGQMDAQYKQELEKAGYRVETVSFTRPLSPEYLKQFGVVILARLPYAGEQYQVGGERLAPLAGNLALIDDYLAAGGGVIFEPAMSEFGEAYAEIYNRYLARYGAQYLAQQLRDNASTTGAYAAGEITGKHPITQGLKTVLYPINVLRWDHAYSTTPFATTAKEWVVLAAGKAGSGTHQALDNSQVGEQLTTNRTLFAVRPTGKGLLAVSAIHSYYTLTHAYSKAPNLGENNTGVIDGIVLHGEQGGRASDMAKLLDQACRFLAANSAKNGLGTGTVALPEQPAVTPPARVIDWNTATPPPSWRHRVMQIWYGNTAYYDEMPDPAQVGDMKFFKVLIGARTAYSSGTGTVREYREAAIKAGYSAIIFTETLADITKAEWDQLVRECDANSDGAFVCLPGFDLEDFQGGHYLVLCARRYPDPSWLTPDGKRLQAVRMLSLGWSGHVTSVHRPGRSALHPKMYKHYQGITVATYDSKGKLVDDGLSAYQWAVASDSNPIPIAAHEVTAPADVATAAAAGYQQIMPATTLAGAIDYFRFGLPHYFDCPLRYFISEGPILSGWSIRNKDIGDPAEGRDHFRLGIGIDNDNPLAEVTLYDGLDIAGRWLPGQPTFSTQVDGFHDMQHEYMVLARDSKGRRVLSPGIRTVTRNWRLRCGDRQNWLGSVNIYTGWKTNIGGYSIPFRNTREGGTGWLGDGGGNPCPIFDYPFFSNHARIEETDLTTKYIDTDWEKIGGDAKPTYAVRPTDFTDGYMRNTDFVSKSGNFAAMKVEVTIRVKRDVEPDIRGAVYPTIATATGKNDLLILPGKEPVKLSTLKDPVNLPAGSYVGGIVTLTEGLRVQGRNIGFPAPPADTLTLPEGTTYEATYLVLRSGRFAWNALAQGDDVDAVAEQALAEMGLRGTPPAVLNLRQGAVTQQAGFTECTAQDGGITGTCTNAAGKALLDNLRLQIHGLNPRCASALWRADSPRLDYFACYRDTGYVGLNADKTVDFYAGNVANCDPALFVSVVVWNDKEAWFRVNNPTTRDITTTFTTVPAIKGYKAVSREITVKAGQTVEVKE